MLNLLILLIFVGCSVNPGINLENKMERKYNGFQMKEDRESNKNWREDLKEKKRLMLEEMARRRNR